MKWKENTKDLDKMMDNLIKLSEKQVGVGWYDKYYGPDNDNLPVAQVAQWQEMGTPNGIPPRPMVRVHLVNEVKGEKYKKAFSMMFKNIAENKVSLQKALTNLGQGLEMSLKKIIDEGVPPPNSPAYAASKGGLSPLTLTGYMQETVSYKVDNKGKD